MYGRRPGEGAHPPVPKKAAWGYAAGGSGAPGGRRAPFGVRAVILRRMARSSFLPHRLRRRLAAYRWRRVGVLAASSLALSLALVLYLFGTNDHFFSRLFTAFCVSFWLLAATFLAIIPFISWATAQWFGRGWEPEGRPARPVCGPERRRLLKF